MYASWAAPGARIGHLSGWWVTRLKTGIRPALCPFSMHVMQKCEHGFSSGPPPSCAARPAAWRWPCRPLPRPATAPARARPAALHARSRRSRSQRHYRRPLAAPRPVVVPRQRLARGAVSLGMRSMRTWSSSERSHGFDFRCEGGRALDCTVSRAIECSVTRGLKLKEAKQQPTNVQATTARP